YSGFYAGANMGTQTHDIHDDIKCKRTKPLAELLVGYDRKIEDFKLGVELLAGTIIGKMRYNNRDGYTEYRCKYKTPWCISLMPRVGLVAPKFELYGTFGVRIANVKLDVRDIYGIIFETGKKGRRSHFQPLVGLGMRYEISNCAFVKLEYNYGFNTPLRFRIGKSGGGRDDVWVLKLQSHTAKLGFGVRF
ncbi:MAG: porin family protein, partial [Alphaproteobacteria bacterium]|nr:porin family protein [Alphaproteobacteria bacterium]